MSFEYKTTDCPWVIALCGFLNVISAFLSLILTSQLWSACLYLIFALRSYVPSSRSFISSNLDVLSLEENKRLLLFPWPTIKELFSLSFFKTYHGKSG